MFQKTNNTSLRIMLCILLIVILSFDVVAADNRDSSIFNKFSLFFESLFQEESIADKIDDSKNESISQIQIIDLKKLQAIINSSDCIQQLPESSAIKLKIFDEYDNKNEFLISYGPKINTYHGQKFDLDVKLSLKNILSMEKSISIDGELKNLINTKDLELNYNLFRVLKYRSVLSCIEKSEIIIEYPEEKIEPKKTQEEEILINKTQENVTFQEVEPIRVTIINKGELAPKKLKYLFDDFENNIPYIVISNDFSDYSNLRAIKLLTNWNYAVESIDYSFIKASDRVYNKNLIFITDSCNTEISFLTTNEEECINLIEGKKGMINFYEDDNRNVLAIIGISGQDLVNSLSILSNYWLFDFNNSDSILADDDMYKIVVIPEKLKSIQDELRSIYDKSEEYEFLVSDQKILTVPTYHAGQFFRDVSTDIANGRYGYHILSKKDIESLNRYDFGELAKKGDDFEDQRQLVQNKIKSLKTQIGTGIINQIINKNSINSKTLQEFESKLEASQKSFEDLNNEYEILTINMTPEIDRKMLDIRRLIGE